MKRTLSVLVENQPGVLSRIAGLFARRGFNIESLAVGVTADPTVSRMTIVVDVDAHTLEQIEKQLNKLIDVIRLQTFSDCDIISRELVLIKVSAKSGDRGELIDVVKIMDAKIIDITRTTATVQISDTSERIENLIELVRPYGIKEIIRTGTIATQKGAQRISLP